MTGVYVGELNQTVLTGLFLLRTWYGKDRTVHTKCGAPLYIPDRNEA